MSISDRSEIWDLGADQNILRIRHGNCVTMIHVAHCATGQASNRLCQLIEQSGKAAGNIAKGIPFGVIPGHRDRLAAEGVANAEAAGVPGAYCGMVVRQHIHQDR